MRTVKVDPKKTGSDLDFKVSMSVPLDKDNEGSCDKEINIKKTVFKRTKKKIVNLNS